MNPRFTRMTLVAVTAGLALTLSACGSSDDGEDPTVGGSAQTHNAADVTFAQEMIPHHGQAVTMAELALDRSRDEQVLDLARRIKSAQDPEIQTMSGWLRDWDEEVPDAQMDMGDETSGMHLSMTGMMSGEQMASLENASGEKFDRLFLSFMIEHHTGAIAMATTERERGKSPAARDVAARIIEAQRAEVEQMQQLLED